MKKTKNKKKTGNAGNKTLLGGAAKSLRKLGKGTASRIGGLSTAQKVVGGAALVALGLNYLSKRRPKGASNGANSVSNGTAADENLAAMDGNA
ncbi:hypothetical protein [Hymenobacter terricola]|uniref:hypothetical protein n=1 Tax=Hymenobacter terricola TaxID=2819236 RepID=UPI001B304AFC|nr:hypothetical protein [Hymenobacter terricola]